MTYIYMKWYVMTILRAVFHHYLLKSTNCNYFADSLID